MADLAALRTFGRCGTGVDRTALSAEDLASRRWLAGRMAQAGLEPRMDCHGTLLGRCAAPRALLLDEPFSRLDARLREQFRAQVFADLARRGIPTVLVTHDLADVPMGARVVHVHAPVEAPDA